MTNVYEWLDDVSIRKMVLPKIKIVFERNHNDLKIVANVLSCIERTLDKLDKSQVDRIVMTLKGATMICCYSRAIFLFCFVLPFIQIIDDVLPLLWEVRLSDPDIILRVVRKL